MVPEENKLQICWIQDPKLYRLRLIYLLHLQVLEKIKKQNHNNPTHCWMPVGLDLCGNWSPYVGMWTRYRNVPVCVQMEEQGILEASKSHVSAISFCSKKI